MSHPTLIQTSLNTGEISPEAYGRVDLARYANAVKTMLNFICLLQGPATRRPGFEYIATALDSTKRVRLLPFEFSTTQAYMLEVGHQYIRFFKDGAPITHVAVISGATQANPCVVTCIVSGHRFVDGQSVTIVGVVGMTQLNGNTYTTANTGAGPWVSTTTFELSGIDSTGYDAYVSDGTATGIYQIDSPYGSADSEDAEVNEIDSAQSADTIYSAHEDYKPRTLTRIDHDDWGMVEINFLDGPYDVTSLVDHPTITITPSATTGTITLTASAALFASTDVGRLVGLWEPAGTWGVAKITVYTNTTLVTAQVIKTLGGTAASVDWKMGAWTDTKGWPRAVTFNNDRLGWGGTPSHPQGVWLSKAGLYTDNGISEPLVDSDALDLILGGRKVNAIRWMESVRRLVVGTTDAEWSLTSATGDGAITPNSKQALPSSQNGSAQVQPVVVGNTIVHTDFHGKMVMELKYLLDEDAYGGEDLTVLANHLTKHHAVTMIAYQKVPYNTLWFVREDGVLLGLTYYSAQDVIGWHRHTTDGEFESIAVIPGDGEDELWAVIKRKIGGSDVRCIERMASKFDAGAFGDTTDAFFVDSGLTYDGRLDIASINETTDVVTTDINHAFVNGDVVRFRVEDDPDDTAELISLHLEALVVSDKTADTFKCKDADGNYIDFSADYITIDADSDFNTVAKNVTTVSGLDHLEGKTVSILADGAPVADQTVSSGAITLVSGASVIHVGLGYNSDLETLNPEMALQDSPTAQGAQKQVTSVILRLNESLGGKLGPDADNLTFLDFVDDTVPMGQPADLFSGDTDEISFKGPIDKNVGIYFRQDQPLPSTILALIANVNFVEEGE